MDLKIKVNLYTPNPIKYKDRKLLSGLQIGLVLKIFYKLIYFMNSDLAFSSLSNLPL
jgi:hypothetical protein